MQFLVPQFIDVEPKLFGPISVRQFVIMAVGGGIMYAAFSALTLFLAIPIMVVVGLISFAFAFLKVNTQPLHLFLLQFIRTFRKPRIKTWQKMVIAMPTRKAPKEKLKEGEKPAAGPAPKKAAAVQNLGELALILDTGGTYRNEEALILPKQTATVKPAAVQAQTNAQTSAQPSENPTTIK